MVVQINTVIVGDCIDVMKSMEDKSVDIIMSSPPFKDEDVFGDYYTWYDSFYKECVRVASKLVIIIQSPTRLNYLIAKYPPKRCMIWGKGVCMYSWRYNPILLYQVDDNYSINKRIWCDCFGVQPICGANKVHVYQDPCKLYSTILSMFRDCKSVLDPCCGSGTTLVCAKQLGMNYIGVDIQEEYCNISKSRLSFTTIDNYICDEGD